MIIKGKERHFELNVQSHEEIAEQLPGKDFAALQDVYSHGTLQTTETDIMIAIALNRGYEDHRHYIDPSYEPDYLTKEDFRFLPLGAITELESELIQALTAGQERTVETQEIPSKKADEVKGTE